MKPIATGMQYFPNTLSNTGEYWTHYKGNSINVYKDEDDVWVGTYGNKSVFGYSKVSVIEKIKYNIDNPKI